LQLLLSDYGAEVLKVEGRDGDMARGWGPPFAGGIPSVFLGLNRGKSGISINLKEPEGLDLCLRLIDKMDVLVENFRLGAMDWLGLGFEAVHRRNLRLVYCSISGYGQNGPSPTLAMRPTRTASAIAGRWGCCWRRSSAIGPERDGARGCSPPAFPHRWCATSERWLSTRSRRCARCSQ
jgi:hypothetical protein